MAFEDIYGEQKVPLYPEATDVYATDLERVDPHKAPSEFAKANPEELRKFVLDRVGQELRSIEESRRALGYYASVCERLRSEHPEAIDRLSAEEQAIVNDIADRLASEQPRPAIELW